MQESIALKVQAYRTQLELIALQKGDPAPPPSGSKAGGNMSNANHGNKMPGFGLFSGGGSPGGDAGRGGGGGVGGARVPTEANVRPALR